jgi:hypothetical protein
MNQLHTNGYLPIDVDASKQPVRVKWVNTGKEILDQNFFGESNLDSTLRYKASLIETPLSDLLTRPGAVDHVRPGGFIYHMSRCGSTLLCNMFDRLNKNMVFYEPVVPWRILQLSNDNNREYINEVFKGVIEIYGKKRLGCEENMIVKFFSVATYYIPVILKAFPKVPRIYLYRDPVEVLVSNLADPENLSQSWFYDPRLTGQDLQQTIEVNTPLENCAYALAGKSKAFLQTYDENCLIVDYAQIGRPLLEKVIAHFNMSFSQSEVDEMMKATQYNAKVRGERFTADKDRKQRLATPGLREVADRILGPVHEELKRLTVKL